MNRFPPNLGCVCFSSRSTDTWYPQCWNAKKKKVFCDVITFVLYTGSASRYALYITSHDNRRPGRPPTSYLVYIQHLLGYQEGSITADQIATIAKDQSAWRSLVIACSAAEGWCWWWCKGKFRYPSILPYGPLTNFNIKITLYSISLTLNRKFKKYKKTYSTEWALPFDAIGY